MRQMSGQVMRRRSFKPEIISVANGCTLMMTSGATSAKRG